MATPTGSATDPAVRVLAHVHKYPPLHGAGAEWMLHTMLRRLVERGDDVFVNIYDQRLASYRLHGVNVITDARPRDLAAMAAEADVVVTHLDRTADAVKAARQARRPLCHVVHNDRQVAYHHVKPGDDVLLAINSQWITDALDWPGRQVLVRPPVRTADYTLERDPAAAEYVTLVNMTLEKGSGVLRDIARAHRARRFLGVVGAYGTQDVRRQPANVTIGQHTANIRDDVYARTRVLLMPSGYESWGRVAVEAATSGVPTIAHPTPGLVEALGPAGIFADRHRRNDWLEALDALDDPDVYAAASGRARARATELEAITDRDLDAFEAALDLLVSDAGGPYDAPMSILSSARDRTVCPVCGAGGCACSPAAVRSAMRGRPVGDFEDAPRAGGPLKVYRTHRGDFRLNDAAAAAQGLIPAGDELAPRLVSPLSSVLDSETFGWLAARYRASDVKARGDFLAALAIVRPAVYATKAVDLAKDHLSAATAPPRPAEAPEAQDPPDAPTGAETPPDGRIGDVLAWVGTDPARAKAAIATETALGGKNRPTLLAELRKVERPAA